MADILIGLGGTGGKILKAFRQRLWTEYKDTERKKFPIGFIYVDTDRAMLDSSAVSYETIHGNCCFDDNDFVDIKTHSDIDDIYKTPKNYPHLVGIIGNVAETQAAVCPVGAAADQKRRAGRTLFASNIDLYLNKLSSAISEVKKKEVEGIINIYIFAGMAGGTGSGSIIDTIVQTRKWFFEHNFNEKQFNIIVFAQIPENTPPASWDSGRYKANGYGALLELNNLFSARYNQEIGTRGAKPPYDVTSNVDYGRLYLSYDNPTPENVREGRIPQDLMIANGMVLYSNKNQKGFTITNPIELAELVANFIYTWIFMPGGDAKDAFGRFVYFENLSGNRLEFDETVNPEVEIPVPVRTRSIGSFGLKRVVVPESALQEHIAYTLGCSALIQLKYNNWSAQKGYRDEPLPFDAVSYVKDEGRRESWKLSRPYFLLQKHIIDGDSKEGWKEGGYDLYWRPCIDAWQKVARGAKNEFPKLIELCRGGYDTGFRGKGVENFFKDKALSINEAYSKQIAEKVENYFFEQWSLGKLSLTTLEEISAKLYKQICTETQKFVEEDIPNMEQKIKANEQTIQSTVADYLNSNAIVRAATFNNRFQRVVELSNTLYCHKTELAAMRLFAQPLCQALEQRFSDLNNRIIKFKNQTDELVKFAKERMSALADLSMIDDDENRDGTENMTLPIIQFYNRKRMQNLEVRLLSDQERMDSIGNQIRKAIVDALQGEQRFTNVQRMDTKMLSKALLGPVYEQIKSFHDKLCTESQDKILGMPIMERLYQKYANNSTALKAFAKDIVTASGIFTEIDMNQVKEKYDNNMPVELGKNAYIERILINLPECKDPDLVSFAKELEDDIRQAIPGGTGGSIIVDTHNPDQNEISILSITNGFPMRAISAAPMLQAEYNKLISQDPKNKIVLLSEGRDGDFRSLFARPAKTAAELREELTPLLIVLLGLEKFIKDNASEEYGIGEKDFFGNAQVTPWGHRQFTEIPFDDRLIEEHKTQIAKLYAETIALAFADIDTSIRSNVEAKKQEIQQSIMAKMGIVMQTENPKKPLPYNDFVKWTKASVEIVMKYNPSAQ